MIIVLLICWRLGESPFGRVIKGLREDATAVRALGKNPLRFHVITFAVTSAMAGVAGTILVYDAQLVAPNQFDFVWNQTIIIAIVIGGMGNPLGPVIGSLIIAFFNPLFEQFVKLDPTFTHLLRLTLTGGCSIGLVLRLRPEGILPEGLSLRRPFKFRNPLVERDTTKASPLRQEETESRPPTSSSGSYLHSRLCSFRHQSNRSVEPHN